MDELGDALDLGVQVETDIPTCQECGVIINWSGRGKKPLFCSAHKSGKSRSSTGVTSVATDKIIDALTETYAAIGMGIAFTIDGQDGQQIVMNAPKLAESWRDLLDNDPKVKKALQKLVQASGWSTVMVAHITVAAPIVMRHTKMGKEFNIAGMREES